MRLVYVLLSPTFGMHQYTADLANRMAAAGHEVHLVTTAGFPRDRYRAGIVFHMPVTTRDTGFSPGGLRLRQARAALQAILRIEPEVVHFTGPHLWNVSLVRRLGHCGIPVVHTIHDMDPHRGAAYGSLLYAWNRLIVRSARHVLVHGARYRERLIADGLAAGSVTHTPLLHLFVGSARLDSKMARAALADIEYQPWALFFGRLEEYKGVDYLLMASAMLNGVGERGPRVVIAGPGRLAPLWAGPLPPRLEMRNRLIGDEEALDLFRRCGLLVLPYLDATQSALIAAAYYFYKPVVVTRTGALPEYVVDGETGFVVEAGHAAGLARCLEAMLSNPGRLARMGAAGRGWYDRQRAAETQKLFDMYDFVARAATRQPR